jgi:protein-L-isoaspartate(D-aspartate) O-methyltransferase
MERIPELADRARENLRELSIDNADVFVGDGTAGLEDHAPYDAILVTAGTPVLPDPLLAQLAPSGRLVAPVGGRSMQELKLCTRNTAGIECRPLISVIFVPLIGKYGWEKE